MCGDMPEPQIIDNILTIIIRDDSPMAYANDSPTYRSIRIKLTEEQCKQVVLKPTYSSGGNWFFESISKCFIEKDI
jgi:hypothetical protein